jgi:polyisoprenoid-binding protein YceI
MVDMLVHYRQTSSMRKTILCLLTTALFSSPGWAQVPVVQVVPEHSSIKFDVKASVKIAGHFEKWTAAMTFSSAEITSGALDIEMQSATVTTGSGMKDKTLKGKNFFDVDQNPTITFKSTKIERTGPATFEISGTFTIRGVSENETLKMTVHATHGTELERIKGTMVFDRKHYGMTGGVPFVKIGDEVEVSVDLKLAQVSGPALIFQGVS